MIRKISTIILMVTIVVTGVLAFVNLRYWESSVRIFQLNSDQPAGRDGRGGFDRHERRERPDDANRNFEYREQRNLPDSLRIVSEDENNFRTQPDSLRQQFKRDDFRGERGSFRGGRGGDFHGGSQISLGKVSGFLAVFALFTLATVGLDKGYKRFINRNK